MGRSTNDTMYHISRSRSCPVKPIPLIVSLLFLVSALPSYGQRPRAIRGFLCANVKDAAKYDPKNPNGEMSVRTRGRVVRFRFVVYGIPMTITRTLNRAWPRTDPVGTEYRITYVTKADGIRVARMVAKTGKFRATASCDSVAP